MEEDAHSHNNELNSMLLCSCIAPVFMSTKTNNWDLWLSWFWPISNVLQTAWHEWEESRDRNVKSNVKIVVYEGDLKSISQTDQDDKNKPVDYRFIHKKKALEYLATQIQYLETDQLLPDLKESLKNIKHRIEG